MSINTLNSNLPTSSQSQSTISNSNNTSSSGSKGRTYSVSTISTHPNINDNTNDNTNSSKKSGTFRKFVSGGFPLRKKSAKEIFNTNTEKTGSEEASSSNFEELDKSKQSDKTPSSTTTPNTLGRSTFRKFQSDGFTLRKKLPISSPSSSPLDTVYSKSPHDTIPSTTTSLSNVNQSHPEKITIGDIQNKFIDAVKQTVKVDEREAILKNQDMRSFTRSYISQHASTWMQNLICSTNLDNTVKTQQTLYRKNIKIQQTFSKIRSELIYKFPDKIKEFAKTCEASGIMPAQRALDFAKTCEDSQVTHQEEISKQGKACGQKIFKDLMGELNNSPMPKELKDLFKCQFDLLKNHTTLTDHAAQTVVIKNFLLITLNTSLIKRATLELNDPVITAQEMLMNNNVLSYFQDYVLGLPAFPQEVTKLFF